MEGNAHGYDKPRTFQRLIDELMKGIKGVYCYGYIDDLIVFSTTWEEHLRHVAEVLKRLSQRNLRVSIGKCRWGVTEVDFLGFRFSEGVMKIDPSKVSAIKDMGYPPPNDKVGGVKMIQSFLGLSGFCRRFIEKYAHKTQPLLTLLKKDAEWDFGPGQKKAWDLLKQALIKAPVLIQANPLKEYFVDTDASGMGIGAALMQFGMDGRLHPVSYIL